MERGASASTFPHRLRCRRPPKPYVWHEDGYRLRPPLHSRSRPAASHCAAVAAQDVCKTINRSHNWRQEAGGKVAYERTKRQLPVDPSSPAAGIMGRKLFIRLVSTRIGHPVLLELDAAEPISGPRLAGDLARHWPRVDWFLGPLALNDVVLLPGQDRLLLCDIPAAVVSHDQPQEGPVHEPAVLVVLRGPDPGGRLALRRGTWVLGRGEADLSVGDLRLSRRHALVRVTETSITLSDERSANGVWFAKTPILERRLLFGDTFRAGDSTFGVLPPSGMATRSTAWPLEKIPIDGQEPGSRIAMMLIGALAPLGLGVGLFLMTHSVFFLAFSAISLLTGGLPALMSIRAKTVFRHAWTEATASDARRRDDLAPPLGAVAAGLGQGTSVDRNGFPAMVIGHGRLVAWLSTSSGADPPSVRLRRRPAGRLPTRAARELRRFGSPGTQPLAGTDASTRITEPGLLPDSPIPMLLSAGSSVWFQGAETAWGPALRAVLVRWLPLLAAGTLRVVVQGPASFLPSEFAMLPGVQMLPVGATIPIDSRPTVVVLICSRGQRGKPGMQDSASGVAAAWLYCGGPSPSGGADVLIDCAFQRILLHPAGLGCNPWLRPAPTAGAEAKTSKLRSKARSAGNSTDSAPARGGPGGLNMDPTGSSPNAQERSLHVAIEGIGLSALACAVGRMLPLTDTGHSDALDAGPRSEPCTAIIVGDTEEGPLRLDLDADGPHILVAGTTGSGKSELLRTLVLGLAAGSGPGDLAFLLVDFKGGATLAPLRSLPHVQLFISDLDAAAGERLLELLGNELQRREAFLARCAATDHRDYIRLRKPGDPPLPKLVVLIDEFRVFATELPDALERVVHIATVGRSLGIHLVLSTQRPAGTVSAPLRANIGSVIALRTIGEAESIDLVGRADASRLDAATPGMAFIRRGGGPLVKFRARVNSRPSVPAVLRAYGENLGEMLFCEALGVAGLESRIEDPEPSTAPLPVDPKEELAGIVERIINRHAGAEPAQNPFSAALPEHLTAVGRAVLRQVPPHQGVIGLLDRPRLPQASALVLDPRTTSRLLVCGLPASGIERVPELLIHAMSYGAFTLPTLLLDGNGTLAKLHGHPAVAGYFGPGDIWGINELLLQLSGRERIGPVLLLVCGLGGWAQVLEASVFMHLEALLTAFARTAPDLGSALVICGDRELGSSRAASLCETRWYFPRGAGPETLMGWPRMRKIPALVGRGLQLGPDEPELGTEFQLLDSPASLPLPKEEVPKTWMRSLPLPRDLSPDQLPPVLSVPPAKGNLEVATDTDGAPALAIGLCGPDNRTFVWSPGSCGLVLGHARSGKGTLLEHLAVLGAPEAGHTVFLAPNDELPTRIEEFLQRHPHATRVLIGRADARLAQASRSIEVLLGSGMQVVLSAEPGPRLLFELGLTSAVRDQRSFLVLDPRYGADADPSGFRLPPAAASIRGRAMVFDRGTLRQVQCVNRLP
ncbi:FtsK/SpoIIIE domain-containing protein [Paeniglutamicibacter antarcticus]